MSKVWRIYEDGDDIVGAGTITTTKNGYEQSVIEFHRDTGEMLVLDADLLREFSQVFAFAITSGTTKEPTP